MTDILTVIWKERKGLFRFQGRRSQALLVLMTPVFLAIYLPWLDGVGWVEKGWSLVPSIVVPLMLVGLTIPDSFAGERERHTLPTLLASRLSDRAILLGKVATSIIFAWGVTLAVLALGLVTVNVLHWDGHILLYRPSIILADMAASLLVAALTAGAGVLISLRSSTAQQAQQTLMAVLLIGPMILQFALFAILESPWAQTHLKDRTVSFDWGQIALIVAAVFVTVDVALLLAAIARFKRARLILD